MWNFIHNSHWYICTSSPNALDTYKFLQSWIFLLWSKISLCQMIRSIFKYDDEKNICPPSNVPDKLIVKINDEIFVRITMIQNIERCRLDQCGAFTRYVLNVLTPIFVCILLCDLPFFFSLDWKNYFKIFKNNPMINSSLKHTIGDRKQ